jgi:hypothetical protein
MLSARRLEGTVDACFSRGYRKQDVQCTPFNVGSLSLPAVTLCLMPLALAVSAGRSPLWPEPLAPFGPLWPRHLQEQVNNRDR